MQERTGQFPLISGIAKIEKDLRHLLKIGKILSIEIDLDQTVSISDETLNFISGSQGFYYLSGNIFVSFSETSVEKVILLLEVIYLSNYSLEIIDGIMVHMEGQKYGEPFLFNVEITTESRLPKVVSVENMALYFEFVPSFRMIWEMTGFEWLLSMSSIS